MCSRREPKRRPSSLLTLVAVVVSACAAGPVAERNRDGHSLHQVHVGMPQHEVRARLGEPAERCFDGNVETWVYQDEKNGFNGPLIRRLRFGSDGRLAALPLIVAAAPAKVAEAPPGSGKPSVKAVRPGVGSPPDRNESARARKESPDWFEHLVPGQKGRAPADEQARREKLATGTTAAPARERTPETSGSQHLALRAKVLSSTFLVLTDMPGNMRGLGSAVAIARDVLLTNDHVVRGALEIRVRRVSTAFQARFYEAMTRNYTDPQLTSGQQDFRFWIAKNQLDQAMVEGTRPHVVTRTIHDAERDLALLVVPGLDAAALRVSARSPRIGEQLCVAGNPGGREGIFDAGHVKALSRIHLPSRAPNLVNINAPFCIVLTQRILAAVPVRVK